MSSYYADEEYPHDIKDIESDFMEAFTKGAQWRINSVWHDASEEPDVDKPVLVNYDGSRYMVHYFMTKKLYRSFHRRWTINRWAYVDDLLPERKEETE